MKRLVVCFDGTWNAEGGEKSETNVVRLSRAVRANSGGERQIAIYIKGVGTSGLKSLNLISGGTGLGVGDNIRAAYENLAQNYESGDEIFLFGFSRGAFSARSLGGLIAACGLLKRQKLADIGKAWVYYTTAKARTPKDFAARFKTDTHQNVEIKFMGVWDTVGALGIPVGIVGKALSDEIFEFHDTTPSRIVRHGAHALAIDEQRDAFTPTLWTGNAPPNSTIEQVWFAGVHSDVGGGYEDRKIADIPLRWMALRAESQGLKLDWDAGFLPPRKAALNALAPIHDSREHLAKKVTQLPSIRRVCEMDAPVEAFEKLIGLLDKKKKFLPTINESVHESVIQRYGSADALHSIGDKLGRTRKEKYAPKNLAPGFSKNGAKLPSLRVTKDFP